MKFTFTSPDNERAAMCGQNRFTTVEAADEVAAREKAMNERWGMPKFGLSRWTGQGLILENSGKLATHNTANQTNA